MGFNEPATVIALTFSRHGGELGGEIVVIIIN